VIEAEAECSSNPPLDRRLSAPRPRTVAAWFNTKAVQQQAFGTFGNAGRNNITVPPFRNFDFVVSRTINLTRIREGLSMQWRAELFNAFNHPNFSPPARSRRNTRFRFRQLIP